MTFFEQISKTFTRKFTRMILGVVRGHARGELLPVNTGKILQHLETPLAPKVTTGDHERDSSVDPTFPVSQR